MIGETYHLHEFENATVFWFYSEGEKGVITKIILFSPKEGNVWNLGFGDFMAGEIQDTIISNNMDLRMVMSTIAGAIYRFFKMNPGKVVFIQPVDHKRKTLYNLIFQKRWHEIMPLFEVKGWIADKKEPYSKDKIYDAFEIAPKNA